MMQTLRLPAPAGRCHSSSQRRVGSLHVRRPDLRARVASIEFSENSDQPIKASSTSALLHPHTFHYDGMVDGRYRAYMKVRHNEVDASGVVSTTAVSQYLYYARCSILEGIGLAIEDLQVYEGITTATTKMELVFRDLLRPRDRFYADAAITEVKAATIKLHERVVRLPRTAEDTETVVAESETTVVSLNADYKPFPWPTIARKILKKAMEGEAPPYPFKMR